MTDRIQQAKPKRLSKSLRTHVRRLKQAARRDGIAFRMPGYLRTPGKAEPPRETDESKAQTEQTEE